MSLNSPPYISFAEYLEYVSNGAIPMIRDVIILVEGVAASESDKSNTP